jgi:hypothetical protein
MPWHSLWITQDTTHTIVDALLTLILRLRQWPYRDRFYSEWMPIRWFCVHSIAERLYYTSCNSQNRWHSVDNLLTLCGCSFDNPLTLCWRSLRGIAVSTNTIWPIKAANISIMGKCRITAIGLHQMQHPKWLKLCRRSFSDWEWDNVTFSFAHQGCQYVDDGYQLANGIPMDLLTRSKTVDAPLTLHWPSLAECCCYRVDFSFAYKGCPYFDYG